MRIYYHLSEYISHRKSGFDFIESLRSLGHEVALSPEEAARADLAIVHDDPLNYPETLERVPSLRRIPWIAYAVWEGSRLPEPYRRNAALADGIWTCSSFAKQSFGEHFPYTKVVPHVVRRRPVSQQAVAAMRDLVRKAAAQAGNVLQCEPGGNDFIFFSVVDSVNPRKNVVSLLSAFAALKARVGRERPVWLLLKQYRKSLGFAHIPGVISLEGDLSDEEISALHNISNAYVSAHHAEGWGLGLSEAMAYGKPVVATGYSGNMDFMDASNSLPVAYDITPVSSEMCSILPLFTPDMTWAEVRLTDMVWAMRKALDGRYGPDLAKQAAAVTERFGVQSVAAIMQRNIDEFMAGVRK